MTHGTSWHWLLLIGLAAWSWTATAWACDPVAPPRVSGLLGGSTPDRVPHNFAVVDAGRPTMLDDGTPLGYAPIAEIPGISRVVTPVPRLARVQSIPVDDLDDTTPPLAATITGGAFTVSSGSGGCAGTCGPSARVSVDIDAPTDDWTPTSQLTYALFVGETAEEVNTALTPDGFFFQDRGGAVWRDAVESEGDRDIWVTLVTIDLAGNVSPRATPMQIHSASSGCRVARRSSTASSLLYVLVPAVVLCWRKRRATP